MAKKATLTVTKRQDTGTRKVRRLRETGMIPAILYGHGETPEPLMANQRDLLAALHVGSRLLELTVDGNTQPALIKEVQYDAYNTTVVHLDLARVRLDERVEVTVPIALRGKPAEEGGVLQVVTGSLKIECVVTEIPEEIRVNVGEMKIGDMIKAKDIVLPAGAKMLLDPEILICTVVFISEAEVAAATATPEAGAAAEPEVIREKKEEEGEEGAGEKAEKPEKKEKKE